MSVSEMPSEPPQEPKRKEQEEILQVADRVLSELTLESMSIFDGLWNWYLTSPVDSRKLFAACMVVTFRLGVREERRRWQENVSK